MVVTENIFNLCPTLCDLYITFTAFPGGLPMSGASGTFSCQFWECSSHAANVCASGTQGTTLQATSGTSGTSGWSCTISFPDGANNASGVLEGCSDVFKGGPNSMQFSNSLSVHTVQDFTRDFGVLLRSKYSLLDGSVMW